MLSMNAKAIDCPCLLRKNTTLHSKPSWLEQTQKISVLIVAIIGIVDPRSYTLIVHDLQRRPDEKNRQNLNILDWPKKFVFEEILGNNESLHYRLFHLTILNFWEDLIHQLPWIILQFLKTHSYLWLPWLIHDILLDFSTATTISIVFNFLSDCNVNKSWWVRC